MIKKEALYHLLFWISFFLFIETIFTIRITGEVVGLKQSVITNFTLRPFRLQLIGFPLKVLFFYLNLYFFLPKYVTNKSKWLYLLKLISLVTVFYLLDYVAIKYIYLNNLPTKLYILESYNFYLEKILPLLYLIVFGISTAYFFISAWLKNEKQKMEMLTLQFNTELALLKNQISPHFLFNSLNNLFSLAQKHNIAELENGISTLAGMMRYITYESNSRDISLKNEIAHIENYISVFKLSTGDSDNLKLDFNIKGDFENVRIAPFLLIPLIENALKFGIHFNHPSKVKISLVYENKDLTFYILNTDYSHLKKRLDNSSGVGLKNVVKRLQLIYPDSHSLKTEKQNNNYVTQLLIHFPKS
jgi:two-component system, LytTR family, sensor kinase